MPNSQTRGDFCFLDSVSSSGTYGFCSTYSKSSEGTAVRLP